ncbi:MAG: hypothetical protein HYT80_08425, partial [Euryarchaeota archaeon]|nr:hypothetical protein [Euryarchaeota archaeon]
MARVARDDDYSPTVPFAHALDGLILAVDALCQEKGQEPPRRHDDGPKVFLELIRRGAIPEQA